MAFGLLLPNLTYQFFFSQQSSSGIFSTSLSFDTSSDFFINPNISGGAHPVFSTVNFNSNADFNLSPSQIYSNNINFISNTDFYVSGYVIDTSAIVVGAVVKFHLKAFGVIKS